MLAKIRTNIKRCGYHVYIIAGKQAPRFAYTIGVSPRVGAEIVLAGAAIYTNSEVKQIIDAMVARPANLTDGAQVDAGHLGCFTIRKVAPSWATHLVLGAIDYYDAPEIRVLQLIPDEDHWTLDVPDLSQPRGADCDPVWQWLTEPWRYTVSDESRAVTNIEALRGECITEVMRWEIDEWEMFAGAGPDVPKADLRVVPLGVLLGADPTLSVVTELEEGKGLWRESNGAEWHEWG